jgi:hypothetical protein
MSEIRVSAQSDFLTVGVIGIASLKNYRLKVYERNILLTQEKRPAGIAGLYFR